MQRASGLGMEDLAHDVVEDTPGLASLLLQVPIASGEGVPTVTIEEFRLSLYQLLNGFNRPVPFVLQEAMQEASNSEHVAPLLVDAGAHENPKRRLQIVGLKGVAVLVEVAPLLVEGEKVAQEQQVCVLVSLVFEV